MGIEADIDPIRAEAKRKADKAVKIMAKNTTSRTTMPKKHYEPQWKSCRFPERPANDWQQPGWFWISLKSRPASKSEVTIGKAEEFLASLLTDEDEEQDGQTAPESS